MEKLRSELFALVQPSSLNSGGIKKNQTAEYKNSHFAYASWSLSASTFPRKFSGLFLATFFFFFPEAVSLEDIFSRTVGSGIQLLPELLSISAAIGAY